MNQLIKKFEEFEKKERNSIPSYSEFTKKELEKYDSSAVGTIAELKKGRELLERTLKEKYNKIKKESQNRINKKFETFLKEIFEEAYCSDNEAICQKIWEKAWADGHSSGLEEVVDNFYEYDEFVYEIEKLRK